MQQVSFQSVLSTIINGTVEDYSIPTNNDYYVPLVNSGGEFVRRVKVSAFKASSTPSSSSPYDDDSQSSLPANISSSAQVKLDGVVVSLADDKIERYSTFDTIAINNVGEDHNIVFVPSGSSYGSDDNIQISANGLTGEDYGAQATDMSTGNVYIDDALWFNINVVARPNFLGFVQINGSAYNQPVSIGKNVTIDWPLSSVRLLGSNLQNSHAFARINGITIAPSEVTESRVTFNIDPSFCNEKSVIKFYKSDVSGLFFSLSFARDEYYYEGQIGTYEALND